MIERKINDGRAHNSAERGKQRVHRSFDGVKIASRQKALYDLDRGDPEEEDHEDIVRQEVKAYRPEEVAVEKTVVALRRLVPPGKRGEDPGEERY